jgi:hypothetical protein
VMQLLPRWERQRLEESSKRYIHGFHDGCDTRALE